jgi:large subunit ribosomal protein L15
MPLTLSNLKSFRGASKNRKRVGRGNSSGHGTYSTRGAKGQKARSGGKRGLKLKGFKRLMQNIPKLRGFKSLVSKMEIVNIQNLELKFENGAVIDGKKLVDAGIIRTIQFGVKILGGGKLAKNFVVKADAFSSSAKEAIEKAGGKAEIVKNNQFHGKKDNK